MGALGPKCGSDGEEATLASLRMLGVYLHSEFGLTIAPRIRAALCMPHVASPWRGSKVEFRVDLRP
jgi:hypothetical protein